ncbi:MAG: choice-of-anchor D domain-containing protein [Terriglobales bacterium]
MPNTNHPSPWAGALAAALALAALPLTFAQSSEPAITLVKTQAAESENLPHAAALAQAADYRQFGHIKVGQSSPPEVFTLDFHRTTTISRIAASNDFHISGGTCLEQYTYLAGDVCSVELVFTPHGPGHRTGTLKVFHDASEQPFIVPTGGEADGPAVSFIPSLISTVPGTFVGGNALLIDAQGLAIDGGDSLYIADTGNALIRYQDSSGVLSVFAGGGKNPDTNSTTNAFPTEVKLSAPYGVAIDILGDVWISDTGNKVVRVVNPLGPTINTRFGGGPPTQTSINPPRGMVFDPSNNLFLNLVSSSTGAAIAFEVVNGGFALTELASTAKLERTENYPLAVDADDNLYYPYEVAANPSGGIDAPVCNILAQNYAYSTASSTGDLLWKVAGTYNCGFSGDGGLATGAEINTSVQGLTFDAAGNFYFTDTNNNRVRRIDGLTGIIRTVAGNGTAAFAGDGGPSTSAAVWAPTGLGVDSMGNVYTIAVQTETAVKDAAPKEFGVVREFGAIGQLTFPPQIIASPPAVQTVLVSNVGNAALNFTSEVISGANPGDFAIAPDSSCNFTQPLESGRNCLIAINFAPTASGARSAVLTLLDNTVNGSNLINLSGTAGASAAKPAVSPTTVTFPSQTVGTSSTAKAIQLINIGGLPLTIDSYNIPGNNFSETHAGCGTTLAPGGDCFISVTFKPATAGTLTATLSVATTAGTVTVTLTGTAVAPAVKSEVTLSAKTNPASEGQTVVLDSKVAASDKVLPTGMVQLKEDDTVLHEAKLVSGVVTFKLSNLPPGTHTLTAHYLGDKLHKPAESPAVKQVVKP